MDQIDILLTTYNGEKYLKEQIDSILSQTYTNFRLLISDDCSKDSTPKILEEYRKNVVDRYKISEEYIEQTLNKPEPENFNIYEIMQQIGKKRGCIISGGEIDDEKTAKVILDDFRSGKLGNITLEKAERM